MTIIYVFFISRTVINLQRHQVMRFFPIKKRIVGVNIFFPNGTKGFRVSSPPTMTKKITDISKDPTSEKRKGCSLFCQVSEEYVTCPSCKIFVWHKSCVAKICRTLSLPLPDCTSDEWKCPNCP